MGLSKDLHIGFFETDHAQRAYLQSLLLQAGYTVSPYPQATESLEDVLASIMEASETIPHDLLIIHLPAASSLLPDSLLIALQQLTHEDLPLILLTNTRSQGLRLLHAGLPHTSILPHYPLPLTDLFDTIARLTHQTPSHTSDFFQALLLLQSQQHAFMQERERVWLGQREEWLD